MKNNFTKLLMMVVFGSFLFAGQVFAETPSFDTLSVVVRDGVVIFRGDFNSNNNNYFPTNQPLVWFEYGQQANNLSYQTIETPKNKGNYIVSHSVYGLEKDRTYYYRAAIRFDSETSYGETRSFVNVVETATVLNNNLGSNSEINDTQATKTDSDKNAFLTPAEQYQQYLDATASSSSYSTNKNNNENTGTTVIDQTEPLSFWDNFFSWGKKDKISVVPNNSVKSDEEIAAEQKRRDDLMLSQEKNNNSAAHDDELGEVIKYNTNYKNNYQGKGTAGVQYVSTGRTTLNYGLLLLFILFLLAALILVHIILKKRKMQHIKDMQRRNHISVSANDSRYSIPVHRDVHDPHQNPNQAFFRNPPQK